MRHNVYGKKLSRNKDERDVLFKTLVRNLFSYGTIETSETKVKAIKGLVDKIINLAKSKTSKQLLQRYLTEKGLQERLIKEILPKVGNRVSGYTTQVKLGRRLGDNTMMVRMSIIGAEELKPVDKVISDKRQVTSKKTEETVNKKASEKKEKGGKPVKLAKPARKRTSRVSK